MAYFSAENLPVFTPPPALHGLNLFGT